MSSPTEVENEKLSWFYIDDNGVEQGPFEHTLMLQWWKAGLLKSDLQVRRNIELETDAISNFTNYFPPHTTQEVSLSSGSAEAEETKWIYVDAHGKEQGPFRTQEMLQWYKAGYLKPTLSVRKSTEMDLHPLSSFKEFAGTVSQSQRPSAASKKCWYYYDKHGNEQGPFSREKMVQWYGAGYFNSQTRVRKGKEPYPTLICLRKDLFDDDVNDQGYSAPSGNEYHDYKVVGAFQPFTGGFAGVSQDAYWSAKNLPTDRAGRQIANFMRLSQLECTAEESAAKRRLAKQLAKQWYAKNKHVKKVKKPDPEVLRLLKEPWYM